MTERSPKIDIRPDHWEIVQSILKKHVPQHEVWAFGSRVKWTAKAYSDLDLAVITDKPLSLDVSASLSDDFSESDLPYKVDVVDWATTSESFRKIIERDRVVAQGARRGGGALFKTEQLASMCEAVVDCPHSTPVWTDSGYVVLRNQNIKDGRLDLSAPSYTDEEHFKHRVRRMAPKAGDIVITREAPMGEVCKVPEGLTCCLGQRQVLLRPKAGVNSDYLLYALQSPFVQNQIRWNEGTGSTVSNIRIPVLEKIEIPRLVSSEDSIADALQSLDAKIDVNRRINQTLEAMAQAIFKSWFVDFDPVKAKITAKAEGRDPLRAAMTAISGKPDTELDTLPPEQFASIAATAALFPDEMEESELGEIPRGWKVSCISQFGDVVCGKTPSKANPEYFGEGIPFIKIPDMHNSMYVVKPSERLTPLGAASQARKTIPSSSICVSCIATVGKVVITHEPSQTNQQINSIVPRYSQYTAYLYFQMAEKEKEFHDLASAGSATLNMNTSTFSKVSVLMPNFEILTKFSALVAPLFSEILLRQKESAILSEIRDTLLPKLLSGELVVPAPTSVVAVGG